MYMRSNLVHGKLFTIRLNPDVKHPIRDRRANWMPLRFRQRARRRPRFFFHAERGLHAGATGDVDVGVEHLRIAEGRMQFLKQRASVHHGLANFLIVSILLRECGSVRFEQQAARRFVGIAHVDVDHIGMIVA